MHKLVVASFAVVAGAAIGLTIAEPARACIHAASAAATTVTQTGQRILVVHDGAVQTTVMQVEYEVGKALPDLAMVLPVPTVPSRYDTGDVALFGALEGWAPLQREQPALRSRGSDALPATAERGAVIELLPPVKTGPYAIQPIRAKGADGVAALAAWLTDNGYAPIPAAALGYYIDNGWAFLAVKTDAGEGTLGTSGALPPLSFSFDTDRVVVPLKLEAQGVFPVRIYMVTTRRPDDADFADANAKGFEVAGTDGGGYLAGVGAPGAPLKTPVGAFARSSAPAELGAVLTGAGIDAPQLQLRVLFSERFGAGAADPSKWAQELAVPKLAAAVAPVPEAKTPDAEPEAEPKAEPETKTEAKAETKTEAKTETKSEVKPEAKSCAVADPADADPRWLLVLFAIGFRRRR